MKKITFIFGPLMVLLLTACAGVGVDTDYQTSYDFSGLKTYSWLEPADKTVVDPLVDNDLMKSRVQSAVNNQLSAQGYQLAAGDDAVDFLVSYHVKAEDKLKVRDYNLSVGFGYRHCNGGCFGIWGNRYNPFHHFGRDRDIDLQQYKEGVFFIDIVEPATKKLIWRGVAGKRLSTGTPEERDEYVSQLVSAILLKFPPSGSS